MDQDWYRKLVSGRSSGWSAKFLRFPLRAAAGIYSVIIWVRNFAYDKKRLKIHSSNVPVISVGNITVGGTGKTPLVIWICELLAKKNIKHAILTRGYKAKKGKLSDEPAILAKNCSQAKVIVNPDRVKGSQKAVDQFGVKAIVLDDGFQHRRLARDVDIVTIDAMCPFGYNAVLPAGLLRETAKNLKRADAAVITRCDQSNEEQMEELEKKLHTLNPNMIIAKAIHSPICAKFMGGKEIDIEGLKDKNVFAFCGIGNPDAFLNTIREIGCNLVGSEIYNDHHNYTEDDITDIYERGKYLEADLVLSTQKDWTKSTLLASTKPDMHFAYLKIELKFVDGEEKITELIENALAGKICEV